jgi:hypothetical protein
LHYVALAVEGSRSSSLRSAPSGVVSPSALRCAAIRTFLSYFLDRELDDTRGRQKQVREIAA